MATDRIAVGHSATFIDVTHASIVILHSGWLQSVCTLITEVTFCRWVMNIFQDMHVTFVLPNHCCYVTTFPDPNIALFQLQCLVSEVNWHSFTIGLTVPQQFIFCFVRRKVIVHI